jgi:hypothetical protein
MFLARLLRRIAFLIFWLMSAYLVVMLVSALSDQGQMTGELAASNQAPGLYPMWYAAPDVLDAAQLGIILYPIAAVAFLVASVISFAARAPARDAAMRVADMRAAGPPLVPEETPAMRAPNLRAAGLRAPGTLCTLDDKFVIQAIGADAADLFDLSPAQLVGRPILPLMMPTDAAKLQDAARAVHAHPERSVPLEISLRQPDETVLKVQAQCHAQSGAREPHTVLRLLPVSERGSVEDQLSALWY